MMKHLIATGLSVMLLFVAASNPAKAQTRHGKEVSANQTLSTKTVSNISDKLTPFHLVYLGYQGYLKNQGIPGYGSFISQYHGMRFTAKDLVKAAIQANLLPTDTFTNQKYINAVDSQLLYFSSDG
ncbi:hypothetical protein [Fischerella sp. PCC 9605]|uniref:hypothetical protein n=1 Tax=Fischerella sp. PCC 9605 TaxID=1173024 RepID=UPI0004B82886|nr:hypothetical protein [Fischerella sp. PCC 9605]